MAFSLSDLKLYKVDKVAPCIFNVFSASTLESYKIVKLNPYELIIQIHLIPIHIMNHLYL